MTEVEKTAQQEFDEIYITSSEIGQELGVCRATLVNARRRGLLPDPIIVNGAQIFIWKRDVVRPRTWTLGGSCCKRGGANWYDHTRSSMGASSG
ncbi:hypothetical protein P6F33_gp52 [Pseudomonas phage Quinobequin-P09]|uniref:Uncharacterized protein n=1 Tax=Pseudomonas phage Quinobequin-P09 TaxID=2660687 RepID=A0A5P8PQV1_9CAUD|nr:hypothetical protein P6F33_gp52 [Pseudomonas phage Quinobequin-P09]QFR59653.1 hypothetical protein QuinobequinP09_14 [Pseudomonas phage Quinobequin-P09]